MAFGSGGFADYLSVVGNKGEVFYFVHVLKVVAVASTNLKELIGFRTKNVAGCCMFSTFNLISLLLK